MKNRIGFLAGIFLFCLIAVSCSDNFSPKTEFEEEYALHCILNVDTTFQTAYLSKSYTFDGYNPFDNHKDPAIEGAIIRLKNLKNGEIFSFRGDSILRTGVSRYNTPVKFYSLDNFKASYGDSVEVEAVLANGKVLKSITNVPPINFLFFDNRTFVFNPVNSVVGIRPGLTFSWRYIYESLNKASSYFIPKLTLYYTKADNPGQIFTVRVPTRFFENSRKSLEPIYPGVLNIREIYFGIEAIEKILRDISEGNPNKENFTIQYFEFSLLTTDKMLASFISSQDVFSGELSVRIDAPDFTNIINGIGIFGVYGVIKQKVVISKGFADEFGYKTISDTDIWK